MCAHPRQHRGIGRLLWQAKPHSNQPIGRPTRNPVLVRGRKVFGDKVGQ